MKFDTNTVTRSVNKVVFSVQKHSPQILMGVGIVGVVASAVMACKATLKVNDILNESKETIEKIHEVSNDETKKDIYSEEDATKDKMIVYAQTGIKLVKLYGPSIVVGVLSIGSILMSHRILNKRNIALAAAYATIDKSFKDYRGRVIERFGETIDRELKHNIKAQEIEKIVTDEEGKEKKLKETKYVVNPSDISEYARFFEEFITDEKGNRINNTHWTNDNEYNLIFLKQVERYANDKLRIKGFLFLNEVYEMLGLPRTKAGQVVGWIYDEENPVGDNYVDFGLYKDNLSYSDFVNGLEHAILLDFNVDGNVWEMM